MTILTIQDQAIEVVRLSSSHAKDNAPPIIFLHEGLGSVAMWRDFPQQVADRTGCEAIVYSRVGYGRSQALNDERKVRYMHDEAQISLPALLKQLNLGRYFLFGHSDGGSIALIYAGSPAVIVGELLGLIAMAPHVLVEDITVTSIAKAKTLFETSDLAVRLGRYHQDVQSAFCGWNRIWLHPDFRAWNIEEYLPKITCPVLAIQGEDDEYGTMLQIESIAAQCQDVNIAKLPDCRHSPHNDQPAAVLSVVGDYISRQAR